VSAVSGATITISGAALPFGTTVVSSVIEPRGGDVTANMTFDATLKEITRNDGQNWSAAFTPGTPIIISGSSPDNGSFTVASVDGTHMYLNASPQLTAFTGTATVLSQHDPGADVHTLVRSVKRIT
jgi:hypothetical protein